MEEAVAAKQQLGQLKMCLMMANSSSIIRSSVYKVKVSVESIITIERKEAARMRKEALMTRRLCQEEIENLISHVEGRSVAGAVVAYLVDRSWTEGGRKRNWEMLEADDDLKKWTKRKLELEAEEDARVQAGIVREERMLKKAMLEVEWMDTLTEQLRVLDVWL